MEMLLQDVRYGLRILAKSPAFAAIAVITLALGIGMTTAIFSVVYGVLLHPLDYERPEQIVQLREVNVHGRQMQFADPNFEDVRSEGRTLQGAAEYANVVLSVSGGTEPTRTMVAMVSRDFFPVLRVRPMLGRGFSAEDQRFGAVPVALLGYGSWKQFLGGTTDLSSKKLRIDDRVFSIIGVLPPRFSFPPAAEIWVPREIYVRYPSRTAHNWQVIGRLRDGTSIAEARAELQTIATRLKQQYGQDTMMISVAIAPLLQAMTTDVRPALWILLGAVGFLLLIACANVANLLLVQSAARRHEIAVRFALGATRKRVVRQLVAEALLLSAAGGVLGVVAAFWGLQALLAFSPNVLPRMAEVSLSIPVLMFSLGLCVVVALALGIFSGFRSSSGLQYALAAGGRSQVSSLVSERMSRAIVASQLAITLTLLAGAALLGRSLLRVLSIDPGFRTEHVVTMELSLPGDVVLSGVAQENRKTHRVQFLDEMSTRLRGIPGVEEVGGTTNLPLTGFHPDGTYIMMSPGETLPSNMQMLEQMFHDRSRTGYAEYSAVSNGYFRVLAIPLLRGRLFDARDTMTAPHVALISESLAQEKWPHEDPLGHQLEFGNMDGDLRLLTVVGVVGDVRADNLEHAAFPTIYVDYRQRPQATSSFKVVMRGNGNTAAMIAAARQIVRELDPDIPPKFATLDQVVSGSVQGRRFNVTLLGVFAGTALLLALAGMYGVMAYSVTRRTNEIGVRMALGASRTKILRLVLEQCLMTAAIGIAVGIVASVAVTRTITSLLFGLSPMDPVTFVGVGLLLAAVALLASYIPARRAAKVDPMVALRYE
jgi:putative ABC transport system permease protein